MEPRSTVAELELFLADLGGHLLRTADRRVCAF
jgi:hypothetical protein